MIETWEPSERHITVTRMGSTSTQILTGEPQRIWFGKTERYPEPQWLMTLLLAGSSRTTDVPITELTSVVR